MARNEEKAKHSLNKYWDHIKAIQEDGGYDLLPQRRPKLASSVGDLEEAKRWHWNLRKELAAKIARIQNASLPEGEIRELNDDINKLLREREYWDDQVKKLGGPDMRQKRAQASEVEGKELYSHVGYKYFGAAKHLPGVRELFEQQVHEDVAKRKTRKELYSNIMPDYYGWRDEDDPMLILEEQEAEMKIDREHERNKPKSWKAIGSSAARAGASETDGPGGESGTGEEAKKRRKLAHVHTPSDAEIQQMLMEKKRALALAKVAKYISAEDAEKNEQAKTLLGM